LATLCAQEIVKCVVTSLICIPLFAGAQGAFQNLNFEQANPVSTGFPFTVTEASALPYWTLYCAGVEQSRVFYNTVSAGEAVADIIGSGSQAEGAGVPNVIDGNYSVVLQGGYSPSDGPPEMVSTAMEQTGLIPAGDQSLEFKAAGNYFSVSINGAVLPLVALESVANYTLYDADISAYAGQMGTLAFTDSPLPQGIVGFMELDDISFSTTAVPEPNAALLMGIAGLIFSASRRFVRSKS
jgi:hypothetical protein